MSLLAGQVHYLSATTPCENPKSEVRKKESSGEIGTRWQAASVPPRVSGVLETLPRADAQPCAEGTRQSQIANRKWNGAAAGSCARKSSLAGRHSAVKSQPQESKWAGSNHAPGPRHFNKEQTPLAILRYQPTVSRWFFRCLGAHLLRSP